MMQLDYAAVRKRILMLYFAAGLNTLMGFYVISAGASVAERGTVWLIALVFLAFGVLNYYMARVLTRRWDAQAQQRKAQNADHVQQPVDVTATSDAMKK
jgi:membrane protein implicated in regulation of membrane protease activity